MKRVLIISPYFPPTNAADMQRIRMSLPYYTEFGWQPEIVTVDEIYSDMVKDPLLLESLPQGLTIHKVKALAKNLTTKIGLGSPALRSIWFYKRKVTELLHARRFDLIYFSTTQFPVCILGAYWKKRFGVPYVIDMQDPWHSEYYKDKPKNERPPKYWFSYRLNKYLEPIAMKAVDGLISVSDKYIADLQGRYPRLKTVPTATITFGAFTLDNEIANRNSSKLKPLLNPGIKNLVYIGRGGADMNKALSVLFNAVKNMGATFPKLYNMLKISFVGTSYAPNGQGVPTILPLAKQFGIEDVVVEQTDRISYYHTLLTLQQADALFIPGSDSEGYTASKLYPYLISNKPLLAIVNSNSTVIPVLNDYGVKHAYYFDEPSKATVATEYFLKQLLSDELAVVQYDPKRVEKYSAQNLTRLQCELFNEVISE